MGTLTKEIQNFEKITKYPLSDFFNRFIDFIDNDYINLLSYYKGDNIKLSTDIFNNLNSLIKDSSKLNDIIQINKDNFNIASYWDLIETIDNIGIELKTISKLSKWLRSSIINSNYTGSVQINTILGQNENLEKLATRVGYENEQDVWGDIAQKNDLREEDYNSEGGNSLMLVVKRFSDSIYLESVVDNLTGEKVYGKDLPSKFTFNSTDNDFSILNYQETIYQSAFILINLKRGDVPEFPTDGIQSDLVIGSNIGSIAYPVLFKQLYHLFSKDDTFKELGIENVYQNGDTVSLDLIIKTKLNEIINQNISIS